jgi:hypothetical protein
LGKVICPRVELCPDIESNDGTTEASDSFGRAAAAAQAEVFARKLRRSMARCSGDGVARKTQDGENANLLGVLVKMAW